MEVLRERSKNSKRQGRSGAAFLSLVCPAQPRQESLLVTGGSTGLQGPQGCLLELRNALGRSPGLSRASPDVTPARHTGPAHSSYMFT
ncbi:hypothetical protein E2C01_077637 [Portunus trituberculatus]|uniref:Uncharacterized protein n=1 Tax=Portunus trituberculatus TaxID=210409 RepID=A0A5B7IQ84_PORTR|nr:hypothetical protein [Portunus trituberculatus]